jgi:hypothetical protein
MIPDFPKAKNEIHKKLNALLRQKVSQSSTVLSSVREKTIHEGDKMGSLYPDGHHEIREMVHVQSEFTVAHKDVQSMKTGELAAKVSVAAEDIAGQMERGLLDTLFKSIEANGNTIAGNPKLGPESLLVALEKIKIEFEDDDRSKPIMPILVAAPDTIEAFNKEIKKLKPEEMARYNEKREAIFDQKFSEHIADIEARKIVD